MDNKKNKPSPPQLKDVPLNKRLYHDGKIDKAKVSLRIFGDQVDPDQITTLMGCKPSLARRKGDVIPNEKYHLTAHEGDWILSWESSGHESVEDGIIELLNRVTSDLSVWNRLKNTFKVDLFCGLFSRDINCGFSLSERVLKLVADRKLEVGFDIYCPRVIKGVTSAL